MYNNSTLVELHSLNFNLALSIVSEHIQKQYDRGIVTEFEVIARAIEIVQSYINNTALQLTIEDEYLEF